MRSLRSVAWEFITFAQLWAGLVKPN